MLKSKSVIYTETHHLHAVDHVAKVLGYGVARAHQDQLAGRRVVDVVELGNDVHELVHCTHLLGLDELPGYLEPGAADDVYHGLVQTSDVDGYGHIVEGGHRQGVFVVTTVGHGASRVG